MGRKMNKQELISMVQKIIDCNGTDKEIDEMMKVVSKEVPDPAWTNLIYYNDEELTAEQIVEKALSYKPIRLPG